MRVTRGLGVCIWNENYLGLQNDSYFFLYDVKYLWSKNMFLHKRKGNTHWINWLLYSEFTSRKKSKFKDLKFGFWKETSNEKSAFNKTSSIKSDWVFRLWNKSSSAFVSTKYAMNELWWPLFRRHVICVQWVWTLNRFLNLSTYST